MKSLKKTLSLVLVIVMVMGMFGAAGAAYTDEASIQYKEAVGVMTGIGAIEGDAGAFSPKDNLTRAQAAKMVTYATLGASIAASLSATKSTFTDVPASHWALGSIEYLVTRGIVNGRGDGTFDPNGKVTGYELAKMLLASVGFNKNGEYDGTGWSINVAIDAGKANIFTGSKATKYSDPATREEAALYCFNGIKYSPNGVATEKIYGITGWEEKNGTLVPVYGWIDVPAVATGSIMAAVYPTLKPSATTEDDFGRPASGWIYGPKKTPIATAVATPVATFNRAFTKGDLYKALGAAATDIVVTKNSIAAQNATGKLQAVKGANELKDYQGGNGIVTEIYKTAAGLSAVQIAPSFAKVASIVNTKATPKTGAYTTYTVGALDGKVYTSIVDKDDDVNDAVITGDVAKGDMVLYYQDGEEVLYIEAVKTVSGLLTSISDKNVVTIDGTQTMKAAAFTGTDLVINSKQEQTFYVDNNGFILGVKDSASAGTKVALVLGMDMFNELKDGKIVTSYVAMIANPDGTVTTVPTEKTSYADLANIVGKAIKYTVSTKGVYSFTAAGATGTAITSLTTKNPVLASNLYANAATKFVVANFTTTDSGRVPTGTVTVYTGINNVPTYATLKKAVAVDVAPTASGDGIVEVVYIYDDIGAVAANAYVYVIGTYTQDENGYVFDTIVKGEPSTLTIDNKADLTAGLYSKITIAGTTVDTAADKTVKAETTVDMIGNVGNLLFTSDNGGTNYAYASKSIADDVPVFTIYTSTGTVSVGTAAELVTPATGADNIHIVVNPLATSAVAAVYIIVAA